MTREEKDLLLKDLCARLPYGVKISELVYDANDEIVDTVDTLACINFRNKEVKYTNGGGRYFDFMRKPYLRPISSMTESERKELSNITVFTIWTPKVYEWYLEHYFDIHNLIEKGLALEAPKDMYKTE